MKFQRIGQNNPENTILYLSQRTKPFPHPLIFLGKKGNFPYCLFFDKNLCYSIN